ncbi:ERV/ALR sulfhydryl oxidase domain-containing protein [Biscogniauxia sp. FL1348]|nr:ERV/ALR sulfhydryl oxidase domain-containing protein [Biscogniauxia sp. FL1348]
MAADTRESYSTNNNSNNSPSTSTTTTTTTTAAAKLPPGVVLGKDGKPCRSCTSKASFTAWAQQAKSSLRSSAGTATGATAAATAAAGSASATASSAQPSANDCPADVETLGRSTWTLLHSIAATYPSAPSPAEQSDLKTFMGLFSKLYPCWVCAEDFQAYMAKEKIRVGSRDDFGLWLCQAHNAVNTKLGKDTFDCSKWEERWRTGWKDGRCD